jgi:SRSO17 transposase
MLDGRRTSVQPMAERLSEGVRSEVWVIDDVSFPKCGKVSVGVARVGGLV